MHVFNICSRIFITGECLSGALVWTELMRLAVDIGFAPPILVNSTPIDISNDSVTQSLGKQLIKGRTSLLCLRN